MSFNKGQAKTPGSGRKAGTPNKKTEILLEIFEANEYCPAEEAVKILKDPKSLLDDKDKISAHLKLMEFKFPKRKAVEHSGPNDGPIETETYEQYVSRVKNQEANV